MGRYTGEGRREQFRPPRCVLHGPPRSGPRSGPTRRRGPALRALPDGLRGLSHLGLAPPCDREESEESSRHGEGRSRSLGPMDIDPRGAVLRPISRLKVETRERELPVEASGVDCNIQKESTLRLVLRLRGGMGWQYPPARAHMTHRSGSAAGVNPSRLIPKGPLSMALALLVSRQGVLFRPLPTNCLHDLAFGEVRGRQGPPGEARGVRQDPRSPLPGDQGGPPR